MQLLIEEEEEGLRLDSFLAGRLAAEEASLAKISRSQAQKLLRGGSVSMGGKILKPSSKLHAGQTILVQIPDDYKVPQKKLKKKIPQMYLTPEEIPLDIIYEDEDLLVVNKPKGMAVHGAPQTETRSTGTLVNALLHHCMDDEGQVHLSSHFADHYFRPGIVHRIDRQTSGILVAAKSPEAHDSLKEQFEKHTIVRKYQCLCHGVPTRSDGRINSIIGRHPSVRTRQTILQDLSEHPTENLELMAESSNKGKLAKSAWRKLDTFTLPFDSGRMVSLNHQVGLMEFELFTGRTHQIRTQMQRLGHPLLFDPLYRTSTRKKSQLHLAVKATSQEQFLLDKLDWDELQLYADTESNTKADSIKEIGQCLHAASLSFVHPIQMIPMKFDAPLPHYFSHFINLLRRFGK